MKKENDLTEIQLKHRQQMKEKREAIRLRKERTHRLIVRGAIAEKVIKGAQKMTNEEFREALIRAVTIRRMPLGRVRRKTLRSSPRQSARHHAKRDV